MRILGVGLSRTGTRSLHRALEQLGLRSLHYEPERFKDILEGTVVVPDFRRFDDVDAVLDIPPAYFYSELLQAYPDCRCILTIRNENDWWRSVAFHHSEAIRPHSASERDRLVIATRRYVYGSERPIEFLYRKRYREHTEAVLRRIPRSRLLVMDVTAGDGWDVLCPFLDLPEPPLPFPHENDALASALGQQYRATREVEAIVPKGSTLILVDERLWQGEHIAGIRTRPFLERNGLYWGHPVDDVTAISELERMRTEGASFLVFAWPGFWWLDYYGDFRQHLAARYRRALANERLVVYDLR